MCIRYFLKATRLGKSFIRNIWVTHAAVVSCSRTGAVIELTVKCNCDESKAPSELFDASSTSVKCTVEFLQRSLPDKSVVLNVINVYRSLSSIVQQRYGLRSIRPRVDPPRVDPPHVRPKCGRSAPGLRSIRPKSWVVPPQRNCHLCWRFVLAMFWTYV